MIEFFLFQIQFQLSVAFFGLLALLAYVDQTGLVLPALAAILLHELAHLLVLRYYGDRPEQIIIRIGAIEVKGCFFAENRALLNMYLSGPLCNLLFFCLFYGCFAILKLPLFLNHAVCQLAIGVFNLLPVSGLDGGSVLRCCLLKKHSGAQADSIIRRVTVCFCFAFGMISVFLFLFYRKQPALKLAALYLFFAFLLKRH